MSDAGDEMIAQLAQLMDACDSREEEYKVAREYLLEMPDGPERQDGLRYMAERLGLIGE